MHDLNGTGHMASNRVLRGGSWNNNARNVRAACRNHNSPDNRNDNIGFRLVRAQKGIGASPPDPIRAVSAPRRGGECQAGPGVQVAAADAPTNAHQTPTYSTREGPGCATTRS